MMIRNLKTQIGDLNDSLEIVRAFSDEPAYGLRSATLNIITVLTTRWPNQWMHDMGPSDKDSNQRVKVVCV